MVGEQPGERLMGWTDAGQRDQLLACINTSTAHPHGGSSKCGS
jgi:hypothetical protein